MQSWKQKPERGLDSTELALLCFAAAVTISKRRARTKCASRVAESLAELAQLTTFHDTSMLHRWPQAHSGSTCSRIGQLAPSL